MIDDGVHGPIGAPIVADDAAPAPGLTIRDVSRAYHAFLGREVENAAVAGHHITTTACLWDLIELVQSSTEARYRRIGQALVELEAFHTQRDISVAASPEQLARLHRDLLTAWERHGLGVHHHWLRRNEPRYDGRSERWNNERLFESGGVEAERIRQLLERHGHRLGSDQIVATLGGEAFRLARAFAPSIGGYLGIEVSTSAVALAKRALAAHPVDHVRVIHLSDFLADSPSIDLFYSVQTLQHAPPPVAIEILRKCLGRVHSGGLALFQIASHLHDYRFDVERYLEGEGRNPDGEIHAVPQADILALLRRQGFTPLEIIPDSRIEALGGSYFYVARKDRADG